MPRYFTHYWSNDTWREFSKFAAVGDLPDYAGSNLFRKRDVASGDLVYVVTVLHGALYLLAKLRVAMVCDIDKAAAALETTPELLWDADDHIVADAATPLAFDRQVPQDVTICLLFAGGGNEKTVKFDHRGAVDQQTMRGVRELTPISAALLDSLLPPLEPILLDARRSQLTQLRESFAPYVTYHEGAPHQVTVNAYERSVGARAACIAHWGLTCVACGFNFEEFYGEVGRGYIHVHHLQPLASRRSDYVLDPVNDLVPVCPNCHAMIYRAENEPYTIEGIRVMIHGAGGSSALLG
jgi:5-methylcytosine-specific restriction protein A